jgi:hypothetical protein
MNRASSSAVLTVQHILFREDQLGEEAAGSAQTRPLMPSALSKICFIALECRQLGIINRASSSDLRTVSTSAFTRMSLQARCQWVRSSRFLSMLVMYVHASPMMRSVPPSLVGGPGLAFGRGTQDATTWPLDNRAATILLGRRTHNARLVTAS